MSSRLLAGPALVLEGRELLAVNYLVARGAQALRQRDGVALPAHVVDLARQVELAATYARHAMSGSGRDVADMAPGSESSTRRVGRVAPATEPGRLNSRLAANVLGLSVRHVTRIADVLGGVKADRDWSFDAEAVEAYGALRAEKDR